MAQQLALPVAMGVAGFGVYEMYKAYHGTAPAVADLRNTQPADPDMRQRLIDADRLHGGIAILAGATASWLSKSPLPLVVSVVGFVWISGYHHIAMNGPVTRSPTAPDEEVMY